MRRTQLVLLTYFLSMVALAGGASAPVAGAIDFPLPRELADAVGDPNGDGTTSDITAVRARYVDAGTPATTDDRIYISAEVLRVQLGPTEAVTFHVDGDANRATGPNGVDHSITYSGNAQGKIRYTQRVWDASSVQFIVQQIIEPATAQPTGFEWWGDLDYFRVAPGGNIRIWVTSERRNSGGSVVSQDVAPGPAGVGDGFVISAGVAPTATPFPPVDPMPPGDPAQPALPRAITSPASAVTVAGAKVAGLVTPGPGGARYYFEYGHRPQLGRRTRPGTLGPGDAPRRVVALLGDLFSDARVHYRLVVVSDAGVVQGRTQTFTTRAVSISLDTTLLGGAGTDAANAGKKVLRSLTIDARLPRRVPGLPARPVRAQVSCLRGCTLVRQFDLAPGLRRLPAMTTGEAQGGQFRDEITRPSGQTVISLVGKRRLRGQLRDIFRSSDGREYLFPAAFAVEVLIHQRGAGGVGIRQRIDVQRNGETRETTCKVRLEGSQILADACRISVN